MQKKYRLDALPSQIRQEIHAIAELGALTPEDVACLTAALTQRMSASRDGISAMQHKEKAPLPLGQRG
ncbi:hypothetical protein [Paracoccus homiensis]|uniref:hypothetical protein n=1 Tax=Paracoccus homiensis TaxID=364199 RepID=UPI001113692F|nr:hypothetical protein [Paracoccus homiensis]